MSIVQLRPYKAEDAGALAALCNNKKIWLNVRDRFPHPYTVGNAIEWIAYTNTQKPIQNFAVTYNGQLAGAAGVIPKEDIYKRTIEIGYFIGEQFWGKGIATEAVAQLLDYIKTHFDIIRISAEVFEHNTASMRVLEKNGFYLEGVRKKAVVKNNVVMDDYVWVKLV